MRRARETGESHTGESDTSPRGPCFRRTWIFETRGERDPGRGGRLATRSPRSQAVWSCRWEGHSHPLRKLEAVTSRRSPFPLEERSAEERVFGFFNRNFTVDLTVFRRDALRCVSEKLCRGSHSPQPSPSSWLAPGHPFFSPAPRWFSPMRVPYK